jgi:predicted dinucleotide-binding enzyme
MRIGVIGSGHIGGTVARLFAGAGHDVLIANSRGPETLAEFEDDGVGPATVADAAEFGDVVVVAIPLGAYADLPADELADTIVVDAMNYYPGRDGHIAELDDDTTTSTELVGHHLYGSRMVKTFNTLNFATLEEESGRPAGDHSRLALFVAGDDELAKRTVMELVDELGFDPVDTGTLAEGGRLQQPGSPIYGREITNVEARELLGLP